MTYTLSNREMDDLEMKARSLVDEIEENVFFNLEGERLDASLDPSDVQPEGSEDDIEATTLEASVQGTQDDQSQAVAPEVQQTYPNTQPQPSR